MSVTSTHELLAERAAIRAMISFWAALDSKAYDRVADSFAQDGTWHRQGKVLVGPTMVRDAMVQRPAGARTRHVVTNLLATVTGPDSADIAFCMTVFSHTGEADAPSPAPMNVPNTVGPARALMKQESGIWKIAELTSVATFQR